MIEVITPPSVEERLTAAAFTILTDGHRHSRDAKAWAVRFIGRAALVDPARLGWGL